MVWTASGDKTINVYASDRACHAHATRRTGAAVAGSARRSVREAASTVIRRRTYPTRRGTQYSPRSGRIFEALLQEISDMRSANSGDSDKLSALEAEANVRAYIQSMPLATVAAMGSNRASLRLTAG